MIVHVQFSNQTLSLINTLIYTCTKCNYRLFGRKISNVIFAANYADILSDKKKMIYWAYGCVVCKAG